MIHYFAFLAAVAMLQDASPLHEALALLDQLERTSVSAEYRHVQLQEVIEDLNTKLPAPLWADWAALERLRIDPDDRITLRFDRMRAGAALASLTFALGDELERPVVEAHAGQLVLTRLNATAPMRLTTTYDVRDLLANESLLHRLREQIPDDHGELAEPEAPAPPADEPQVRPQGEPADPDGAPPVNPLGAQPAGIGRWPTDLAPPAVDNLRTPTPGEQLLWLILDHVDPEAWMNFGGDRALVTEIDGVLLVTATPSTHRRFRDALQMLRAAYAPSIAIDASLIDLPRSNYDLALRQHPAGSSALAAAVMTDANAHVIWKSAEPVALQSKLQVESSGSDASITLSVTPTLIRETGILRLALDVTSINGNDRRSVRTELALLSDQFTALIELPASTNSPMMRALVIVVHRR